MHYKIVNKMWFEFDKSSNENRTEKEYALWTSNQIIYIPKTDKDE